MSERIGREAPPSGRDSCHRTIWAGFLPSVGNIPAQMAVWRPHEMTVEQDPHVRAQGERQVTLFTDESWRPSTPRPPTSPPRAPFPPRATPTTRSWRSSEPPCSAASGCAPAGPARSLHLATTSPPPPTANRSSLPEARTRSCGRSRPSAGTVACRSPTTPATAARSPARTTNGSTDSTAACSGARRWTAPSASTRSRSRSLRSPSRSGRGSCSSTSTPTPPRSVRRCGATTPILEHYDLAQAVCPGTFTLTDLPWNWKVMFENFNDGYHANRLHHTIQDFCPSRLAAFPVPWDDASNVIFRTNGYTHIDGGFNATTKALLPVFPQLTEEERWRCTFALVPPTLCMGTAPDQAFFFIVTAEDRRHDRRRDRLPAAPERARAPDVRPPVQDERRRRASLRRPGPATRPPRCSAGCTAGSPPRALLVAGREPRPVQPLARPAVPAPLAEPAGSHCRPPTTTGIKGESRPP